jgi:hypothetical protein
MSAAYIVLLVLPIAVAGCSRQSSTPGAKGQVVVAQLPAGAEGVELKDGALKLKDGYDFVKESGSTFAIARRSDGRHVTSGGCGCKSATGTCTPTMTIGIIECVPDNCTSCGLALTVGGASTEIIRY